MRTGTSANADIASCPHLLSSFVRICGVVCPHLSASCPHLLSSFVRICGVVSPHLSASCPHLLSSFVRICVVVCPHLSASCPHLLSSFVRICGAETSSALATSTSCSREEGVNGGAVSAAGAGSSHGRKRFRLARSLSTDLDAG